MTPLERKLPALPEHRLPGADGEEVHAPAGIFLAFERVISGLGTLMAQDLLTTDEADILVDWLAAVVKRNHDERLAVEDGG